LRIDPCIPSNWKEFSVIRHFRGSEYQISVKNPEGVCKDVRRLIVDGTRLEGNLISKDLKGKNHIVEVWMGR
jgi:cellobiose phosphorylase